MSYTETGGPSKIVLASENAALRSRIEELETYHEKLDALGKIAAQNRRENFHSERKLEARIAELEKALAPFAAIPGAKVSYSLMATHYWAVIGSPGKTHFTAGDLLRARAALKWGDRTASVSDGRLLETNLVQPVSETTVPLCDHPVSERKHDLAHQQPGNTYHGDVGGNPLPEDPQKPQDG